MFSISKKYFAIGVVAFFVTQAGHFLSAQSSGPVRLEKSTKLALDLDTQ